MIVIVAEVDAGAALQAVQPFVLRRDALCCLVVDGLGMPSHLRGLFTHGVRLSGTTEPSDDPIHDLHG
jgi:hypothetical protein